MKTLNTLRNIVLAVAVTLAAGGSAWAMDTNQARQDCFRLHHGLMDKPAVQNVDTCWHAHSYQMR